MPSLIRSLFLAAGLASTLPAFAHFPFDMPSPGATLDSAVVLPDAQTTWNIYGQIQTPGQVNFIRLDNLDNEQDVGFVMRVFTKPVYAAFAPSMALLAPGLPPAPPEGLPFTPPPGYGAVVKNFTGDLSKRTTSGTGDRIVWVGQELDAPDTTGGPVYLAVWDPAGGAGEYNLLYDIVPDVENPAFEGVYTHPSLGDANDDGKMDVADVTVILQMIVGLAETTPRRLRATDVFPAQEGRSMQGDGQITIADAIRILRRIVELDTDPFP